MRSAALLAFVVAAALLGTVVLAQFEHGELASWAIPARHAAFRERAHRTACLQLRDRSRFR